jgi:tRNA A-37 threonylcarbamoyl transferase component Bud32
MEETYISMDGGRKYGKGAKGSVFDIFQSSDKDKEYFTSGNAEYKLIDICGNIIDGPKKNLTDLKNNLEKFLIKVYDKTEYYETEKKLTIQLINDDIIKDFIENDNNNIIGIQKNISTFGKTKTIYGLLKIKCDITLDKFVIINKCEYDLICNKTEQPQEQSQKQPQEQPKCCKNTDTKLYKLRDVMRDILTDIINLQEKNYVHCDIKADNIMICDGAAKLIDWDLAIKNADVSGNENYNKDTVCKNRYHGSGTHQSPLITKYLYKVCGKSAIGQKLIMSASETLKKRNIPPDHNKINKNTDNYFRATQFDDNMLNDNGKNLIKYHIDLYSVSHVLYELCKNQKNYKKITGTNKENDFDVFISILQNTITVNNKQFQSYSVGNIEINKIKLEDLLKNIDDNLYIIETKLLDEKIAQLQIYKQKYLKYKQKYLELKNKLN